MCHKHKEMSLETLFTLVHNDYQGWTLSYQGFLSIFSTTKESFMTMITKMFQSVEGFKGRIWY